MSEIGAILERGRAGLHFLGRYLPLAEGFALVRADFAQLAERFDAERGISLESMRDCRAHVLGARDALAESVRIQADIAESLDGVLDTGAESGTRLLERLNSLIIALTAAIEEIPEIVTTKSSRIGALDSEIDGRGFEEIESTVEVARRHDPEARSWIEHVFVPALEARIHRFLTACDDSQADIEDCFVRLQAALSEDRSAESVILPQLGPR